MCIIVLLCSRYTCTYIVTCTSVFLIRSYGAPSGAGRCSVAQCYDNTWAMLVQSIGPILPMVVALLDFTTLENAY